MPIGAQVPSERLPSPKIRLRGSAGLTNDLLGASIQRAITRSIRSAVASVGGLQRVAISAALSFILISLQVFVTLLPETPCRASAEGGSHATPPTRVTAMPILRRCLCGAHSTRHQRADGSAAAGRAVPPRARVLGACGGRKRYRRGHRPPCSAAQTPSPGARSRVSEEQARHASGPANRRAVRLPAAG